MATSQSNGYQTEYDWKIEKWVYSDTKEPIDIPRLCKHCGKTQTEEGYDGCLGYLPNVKHACCGHGIDKPYIILENCKNKIEFDTFQKLKEFVNNL
jgi:hypothetical protein